MPGSWRHTEFIRGAADGRIYFLETSARVGGAHIADLVEAASGLNLWREWAKVELAGATYVLPKPRQDYAGLLVSLARQEHPGTSAYTEPEIVCRMNKAASRGLDRALPGPRAREGTAGLVRRPREGRLLGFRTGQR